MIETHRLFRSALVAIGLGAVVAGCAAGVPGATGSSQGSTTPVLTVRETAKPVVKSTPTPPVAIISEFDAGGDGWAMTEGRWRLVDPGRSTGRRDRSDRCRDGVNGSRGPARLEGEVGR